MAQGISSLALAYIGDAVYELRMRRRVLEEAPHAAVSTLHTNNTKLCCAHMQSEMARVLQTLLTEEELAVYKRGRNAHPGTVPKNQSMSDYRRATGFEALMGYLYLQGQEERIDELLDEGLELCNMKN